MKNKMLYNIEYGYDSDIYFNDNNISFEENVLFELNQYFNGLFKPSYGELFGDYVVGLEINRPLTSEEEVKVEDIVTSIEGVKYVKYNETELN